MKCIKMYGRVKAAPWRLLKTRAVLLALISATLALAEPVQLKVQPRGTNQVELTLGSLETNAYYQVMVRSNSPDGHWIVFTSLLSGSNSTITSIHDLSGVSGLSLNTFSHWTFVAGRWEDALGDEFPMIYKELVLRAYSGRWRTVILISVGQGSDFCRTPFRFLSDRVPGCCRTVFGPDWNGVRQD